MTASIAIALLLPALQTPCNSPGPDLTIADIVNVANFGSSGGVEAVGFGISPLNVGSVWLDMFASTPRHPVFGQSLYRLSTVGGATRIEEIGQSWLRHGFFALSMSHFCGCTATNGQHLGIGCDDSMGASLNADPNALAPRWQVNASTGEFPFPAANPPHPGVHDRRLQVAVADIDPSARFFVEAQCVAPDDAAAGVGANNASHREALVAGSGSEWTFSLTGTTQRERPAIYAWQDADPAVQISAAGAASDGRFLVASRATDLGGGMWHYEYAVLNLSSDRSARAFIVPFAVGTVSSPGFHDVVYHSGDGPGNANFDGTDWTFAAAPGTATFSTDDYATNPSANALRWGTTYNFRFDADIPPFANGTVQLDLFKPGSEPSVQVAAVVPYLVPPPPRSLCFGAGPGSGTCPCANAGLAGRGCENSILTGGGTLDAAGLPGLSTDTLTLTAGGELPTALSLLLQGTIEIAPANYGDGLRCVGGSLKRIFAHAASGGTVVFPAAGDPSISARSAARGDSIKAGETRLYQAYYRDPNPAWCPSPPGSTFNATSAVEVTWGG